MVVTAWNFYTMWPLRHSFPLLKMAIINSCILVAGTGGFVYSLDGLVQLASDNSNSMPLMIYLICEAFKVLFAHYAMVYGSYIWINLYYSTQGKKKLHAMNYEKALKYVLGADLVLITTCVLINTVGVLTMYIINPDNITEFASMLYGSILISTVINGTIF